MTELSTRWRAGILVAVTLAAFAPVFNAGLVWNDDDVDDIVGLIDHEGLSTVWLPTKAVNYWPVTWTSYWIEHEIFGSGRSDPTSFHVVNVLVHVLSSLLLWRILVRLGVPGAWLAALLFAVHPVNVQSVAWVTQRKNVLSLVFYLAAVRWWLDFEDHGGRGRYLAAIGAFWLGMLSKGAVVACPLVLLLLVWWRRRRITRQDVVLVLPFLAIAVGMGLIEIWTQHGVRGHETIRQAGFLQRSAEAGWIAWFYLGTACLPVGLSFVYPQWDVTGSGLLAWLPSIVLVAVAWTLWRHRHGRLRPVTVALAYYLLNLGAVLGFVDIYYMKYSPVADHYQYVALPGLVALLTAALVTGLARAGGPARAAAAAVVVLFGLLTFQRAGIFQDQRSLWSATLRHAPESWLVHNQLANQLGGQSQQQHYERALELIGRQLGPNDPAAAEVHRNLGRLLGERSRTAADSRLLDASMAHFNAARRIEPDQPRYLVDQAGVLQAHDRHEQAIALLQEFLKTHPDSAEAWFKQGELLLERDVRLEGKAALDRAVQLEPRLANARRKLLDQP